MGLFKHNKPLLDDETQKRVAEAIANAEKNTTGEIRVYAESHCEYVDPLERAKELFMQLGMHNTERRNAVIIYIALKDHQFALFGDEEIYKQAGGPDFWQKAAAELKAYLKQGRIADGLSVCVEEIGMAMAQHFPYDSAVHKNELPDEIVFGK